MTSAFAALLAQIPVEQVERFLLRNGFNRVEDDGDGQSFQASDGSVIIIPPPAHKRDYAKNILMLLESFEEPDLSIGDVLGLIVLPESHLVQHRFVDPMTNWGAIPATKFAEVVSAFIETLRFSAAGAVSGRGSYTDIPPEAKEFARQCQFGQTDVGSFIFKLFCPRRPQLLSEASVGRPDFGTKAVISFLENVEFFSSQLANDPNEPLPRAMNRNVAAAFVRLNPPTDYGRSDIKVRFSSDVEGLGRQVAVEVDQFAFSRAAEIVKRLDARSELVERDFVGWVVDLHKDRPQARARLSQAITLDVEYGTDVRKLSVRLSPADYRHAVQWHDFDRKVIIRAAIDTRTRPWSVVKLHELRPLDSAQMSLFDEPSPS